MVVAGGLMKSLYEILQVLPDVIRAVYRSLSAKYHPDKDSSEQAAEQFAQVQQAFETLSDPDKRTQYDAEREANAGELPPKKSSRGRHLIAVAFILLVILATAIHLGKSYQDKLTRYRDINGDSGISAYKYGNDWIRVQFRNGGVYEYQASKIGQSHINELKRLADSGDGLNTYISTNQDVKRGWASKDFAPRTDLGSDETDRSSPTSESQRSSSTAPVRTALTGRWKTSAGDVLDLSESNNRVIVHLVTSSSWISGSGTVERHGKSLTGDLSGISRNGGRRTWKFDGTVTTDNQIDFTVDFYVNDHYENGVRGLTLNKRPVRGYMSRNGAAVQAIWETAP